MSGRGQEGAEGSDGPKALIEVRQAGTQQGLISSQR